jgi:glycosyltransferase involved in cell wall biosynthesis
MRILVLTDDLVGPVMAGSALRAWEISRTLLEEGHDVRLAAAPGSTHPEGHGPPVVDSPPWRWAQAVLAPPWILPLRAFLGGHLLVVDGVTPLLAELKEAPLSPAILRRRRTAATRLPLVTARADAILVAGEEQHAWWSQRLQRRPDVPLLDIPFGIPENDPPTEVGEIPGVPEGWSVVLWWGGVWPWLDLETLLAARARLATAKISVVVPTANRPGSDAAPFSVERLNSMMHRYGLQAPQVVPLEQWVPYAERHRILNRTSLLAVLHRTGSEAELSFRTRALDGVWAGVPVLLSEGGAVARLARAGGWGGAVPPEDVDLVTATLDLLLGEREQLRCREALRAIREDWRWSVVTRPLVDALPELPKTHRGGLAHAAARSLVALVRRPSEDTT